MSEKAEEMAQAWLPTTHVGNPEESLGCWLLPGPASTVLAIWGADGRSLCLCLSFPLLYHVFLISPTLPWVESCTCFIL